MTSRAKAHLLSHTSGPERVMLTALFINALNTAYLSWRYIALHAGWVRPGTGICSWTAAIDCDRVLLTQQARAFYVPNALLGIGFSVGCLLWWLLGKRLGPSYRYHLIRTLAFWLAVSTIFTFRFFWLLIHLDYFCPFCPWHHLLTYVALAGAIGVWRSTPRPLEHHASARPLVLLVALCVSQFFFWQIIWAIAYSRSLLTS